MLKEMHEQSKTVTDTMSPRIKDGEMAKNAGADYLILKKWKIIRNLYY